MTLLLAFAFYLVLAILMTWPIAADPSHFVAGGYGDPLFTLWQLGWNFRNLSPDVTQHCAANIFYPLPTAGLHDNIMTLSLLGWPLFSSNGNLILTYNLLLFFAFAASGAAAFILVRALTGSTAAALVSGTVFAFSPYRFSQIGHLQLLSMAPVPLAFWAAHRLREASTRKHRALYAAAMAVSLAAAALTSGYHGAFLGFFLLCYWLWHAPSRAGWALAAFLGAAAIVAPLYLPYHEARANGYVRTLEQVEEVSPGPLAFLRAEPKNWVYGGWLRPAGEGQWKEDRLFLGFVGPVLALAGAFLAGRRERFYLFMLGTAAVLTLGPFLHVGDVRMPLPYLLLYYLVPGFDYLRFTARLTFYVLLAVAVLAGFGTLALTERKPRVRHVITALLVALALLEGIHVPLFGVRLAGADLQPPPVYQWLNQAGNGPVLELPMAPGGRWDADTVYMYYSTFHWQPLINGYAGYIPKKYVELAKKLSGPADDSWLYTVEQLGMRYVVIHEASMTRPEAEAIQSRLRSTPQFKEIGVFGRARVFAVR